MVCGAGVIGITTAYELAERGHQVSVVDRREGPAQETSFANGGQISPSHADPWVSPRNLMKVLGWLGRADAPLRYRLRRDPALWEWTLRFLGNCRPGAQINNTERMLRVALFGARRLRHMRDTLDISYDARTKGILQIFDDQQAFDATRRQADRVTALGCPRLPVDAETCRRLEPALSGVDGLVGGFHCPDDETGDAQAFTAALAEACVRRGVRFYYDVSISAMTRRGAKVVDVRSTQGPFRADAFVLALGAYSPLVARTADVHLPVQPAKGYSVTLPILDTVKAPTMGLIDDARKHVYSRLGGNLRVAGMAEIGGFDTYTDRARIDALVRAANSLFPGALGDPGASAWAGLRPQTPDGVPIIGQSRVDNLFINTGHGTLGWTMACGSAALLADLIDGRRPEIDPAGLGPSRFRGTGGRLPASVRKR